MAPDSMEENEEEKEEEEKDSDMYGEGPHSGILCPPGIPTFLHWLSMP